MRQVSLIRIGSPLLKKSVSMLLGFWSDFLITYRGIVRTDPGNRLVCKTSYNLHQRETTGYQSTMPYGTLCYFTTKSLI